MFNYICFNYIAVNVYNSEGETACERKKTYSEPFVSAG